MPRRPEFRDGNTKTKQNLEGEILQEIRLPQGEGYAQAATKFAGVESSVDHFVDGDQISRRHHPGSDGMRKKYPSMLTVI